MPGEGWIQQPESFFLQPHAAWAQHGCVDWQAVMDLGVDVVPEFCRNALPEERLSLMEWMVFHSIPGIEGGEFFFPGDKVCHVCSGVSKNG